MPLPEALGAHHEHVKNESRHKRNKYLLPVRVPEPALVPVGDGGQRPHQGKLREPHFDKDVGSSGQRRRFRLRHRFRSAGERGGRVLFEANLLQEPTRGV